MSTMDYPSKGFKGPHWARYCHHTENPIQVTKAPVSTRPRTGMPSMLSWQVMGGPTAHSTGVTLDSGDPSNSLTVRWGKFESRPRADVAPGFVLEAGRELWCALVGGQGAGGLGGPDGWRRSAPLLHRRSNGKVVYPSVGVADGKTGVPQDIPDRGGERERGQAEAVERPRLWE